MKHSAATKRKLSRMRRGRKNPFYGRKHSEKFKAALRVRMLGNTYRRFTISPCTLKTFDDVKAGYMAAMIDGEGSIQMHREAPQVAVHNTSVPLMRWLVKHIGGSYIKASNGSPGMKNVKQCYTWNVAAARNVYVLLVRVRPLLVIKGDKADAVLARLRSKYGEPLLKENVSWPKQP